MDGYVLYYNIEKSGFNAVSAFLLLKLGSYPYERNYILERDVQITTDKTN